jgi:hypothetical protein
MATSKTSKTKRPREQHFLLAGVAVFFVSGLLLGGVIVALAHGRTTKVQLLTYAQNDTVKTKTFELSINGLQHTTGEHLKAPDGQEFLLLNLHVKNLSASTIGVFPSLQTYIKDTAGKVYYLTPAELQQPFLAGNLAAGDQI